MLEKKITNIKLKFFTNISHEFRTPLTMIINPISEILKEFNTISKTKEEELLILTQKNARRLLHLINDILDFRSSIRLCFTDEGPRPHGIDCRRS